MADDPVATAACAECGMDFYHLATCSSPETLVQPTTAATDIVTRGHVEALQEIDRLRDLLRELLEHDTHRNGPWTMGMRARVRVAIGD